MKDSNKFILEQTSEQIRNASGLKASAEIISKSKTKIFNVFNDIISEDDKPVIKQLQNLIKKKETEFKKWLVEAKLLNTPMQDVVALWTTLATIVKDYWSLTNGNNPFEKKFKAQIEKIWTSIGWKKSDIQTQLLDTSSTAISDNAANNINFINAFVLPWHKHLKTDEETKSVQSILVLLSCMYNSVAGKSIDAKSPEYNQLKKLQDDMNQTIEPSIKWLTGSRQTIAKIDDVLSGKKKTRVKTASEEDATKTAYESLEASWFDFNKQLDQLFDKLYTSQLEEQLHTLYTNNRMVNKEREGLSDAERKYFFMEMILKKTDPERESGQHVTAVDATHCFDNAGLQAAFKQKVMDDYSGDNNIVELKRYIYEKLGVFPSMENPPLIADVFKKKIGEKFVAHESELALQLNHYIMDKFNGKISVNDDMVQHLELRNQYDTLNTRFKFNDLLKDIHDKHYIAQLEYALDDFFKAYPDMKERWEKLNPDHKRFFFDEMIMKTAHPVRGGGHITPIDKDNNLTKDAFYNTFKYNVAEEFDGEVNDTVAFKNFIEEKIWTLSFTKPNPEYALWLMRDTIKNSYDGNKDAIGMHLNGYQLGVDNGSVAIPSPSIPGIDDVKELGSVVADAANITEEQARAEAMKEIEREYAESMPYGYGRAKLFFFRSRYVNRKIAGKLKKQSWKLVTDEEVGSAVNRWHLKKAMNMAGSDKIEQNDNVFDDPAFNDALNTLVNDYVSWVNTTMTDAEFTTAVMNLINKNDKMKSYMKDKDISQIGTNFVNIVTSEKKERAYYGKLIDLIDRHGRNVNTPEFDTEVRKIFAEFVQENKKLPEFVNELKLDIDAKNFAEKLATHREALQKMKMRNVKMKLSMLTNTDNKDKWLAAANSVNIDALGARGKLYKWMEKHPRWTVAWTSATLVATSAIWMATLPIIGAWLWASALFAINFIKKRGHYTKEHAKFEQTLLAMKSEDRDTYIKSLEADANKRPQRLRRVFPKKYDKFAASLEYMQKVTSLQTHIDNLQRYLRTGNALSASEKTAMQQYLTDAVATFQLREEEGRNFVFSQDGKEKIEEKYNELHTAIRAWLMRYDATRDPDQVLADLSGSVGSSVDTIKSDSNFEKDQKRMRNMRTTLWLFAWGKAAWIYLVSAWMLGQVREWWDAVFGNNDSDAVLAAKEHVQVAQFEVDVSKAAVDANQAQQVADQAQQAATQKMHAINSMAGDTPAQKMAIAQAQLDAAQAQQRATELAQLAQEKANDVTQMTQDLQSMESQLPPLTTTASVGSNIVNNTSWFPATTNPIDFDLPTSIESAIKADPSMTGIDLNNVDPTQAKIVNQWLSDNGYQAIATNDPHVVSIVKTMTSNTAGGLHLDPAFGTDGSELLTKVFDGDTAKFEAFKTKISSLSVGDRQTTLWDTLKDLYGGDHALANEKTHAFFENFGDKIMEWNTYELIELTKNNPLTSQWAESIAAKMSGWYTGANMLSPSELKIVTDPSEIKALFDGMASGKFSLTDLPDGRNIHTANDALHCKYGWFGDGLKEYIFDTWSSTEVVGEMKEIIPGGGGNAAPGANQSFDPNNVGWNRWRFTSFGAPSLWNEINDFRKKKK